MDTLNQKQYPVLCIAYRILYKVWSLFGTAQAEGGLSDVDIPAEDATPAEPARTDAEGRGLEPEPEGEGEEEGEEQPGLCGVVLIIICLPYTLLFGTFCPQCDLKVSHA